jgi:excisionase family DNA binding protein
MTIGAREGEVLPGQSTKELIPIRDAARTLSVHTNTLRRWHERGIIRAYRIGSRGDRRFFRDDVLKLKLSMMSHEGKLLV